ncbi:MULTISPECIES: serine hydrolase domain-containing protein [Streptomyces]|uniref:serine hydrolase domain-containing protein n=1 Tax=Streptomyces TaxID=1883 RepID=UPI001E42B68B|nr:MULTISPECIES: serine hydrolase domain-containing protein [Streptomyces]UFQ19797.1 beta-lactamase family protein [Streptomyces huasconensis]WCL89419.1 serine hydrolase [Streptomyces sp. JCM 35825]
MAAPDSPAWAVDLLRALRDAAPGASTVALAVRHGPEHALLATGETAWRDGTPADADTRFEIGSLTKTFTGLLLAEMVARGEVAYNDPISRFLPRFATPGLRGSPITLLHLATHTSGLPRLPPGLLRKSVPTWFSNPYACFSSDALLDALARTRPRAAPGVRVHYSNYGVGLLGELLVRAAHGPGGAFATLVAERVLDPLGLTRTSCAADQPQATGYWHGRARPSWHMAGMAGAAAGRSCARDLLTVLDGLCAPGAIPPEVPDTLRTALTDVTVPRIALPATGTRIALVWNIRPRPGHDLYHHSGGTRGFTCFAGFSPRTRVAFAALANTSPSLSGGFIQRAYLELRGLAQHGGRRRESQPS